MDFMTILVLQMCEATFARLTGVAGTAMEGWRTGYDIWITEIVKMELKGEISSSSLSPDTYHSTKLLEWLTVHSWVSQF